jgi:hypothetical protein
MVCMLYCVCCTVYAVLCMLYCMLYCTLYCMLYCTLYLYGGCQEGADSMIGHSSLAHFSHPIDYDRVRCVVHVLREESCTVPTQYRV